MRDHYADDSFVSRMMINILLFIYVLLPNNVKYDSLHFTK